MSATEQAEHAPPRETSFVLWAMVVAGVALLSIAVTAVATRGLLARGESEPPAATATHETRPVVAAAPDAAVDAGPVDEQTLARLVDGLGPRRGEVLADAEAFRRLAGAEATRRAVLRAARASGLPDEERVAWLMGRGAEQVLIDAWMRAQIARGLGQGFPSEEQMSAWYEANQAGYALPERVTLWQIFLPVPPDATTDQIAQIETRARVLVESLRGGDIRFEAAAAAHSAHGASRLNGGAMGMVKVADLLPELRERLLALPEGRLSEPLRAGDGFHIVRRGPVLPARQLPLAGVRDRVRADMTRAAVTKLRQAAAAQVQGRPDDLPAADVLERWRRALEERLSVGAQQG